MPLRTSDLHCSQAYLGSVMRRCSAESGGAPVSNVISAVLGLPLALQREVTVILDRASDPATGHSAGPPQYAVLERLVEASRRQLALLCNALGGSSSAMSAIAAAGVANR